MTSFTTATSKTESFSNELGVYPNPSDGVVNLNTGQTSLTGVNLFDVSGRLIESFTADVNVIDLSDKAKGVYLLEFLLESGESIKEKIIIE